MEAKEIFNTIINAYDNYCLELDEKNRKERYENKESWFKASNAGLCIKKLFYEQNPEKYPKEILFTNEAIGSRRTLRMGDLIHNDLQKACQKIDNDIKVYTEGNIEIKKWNVRGHYDLILHAQSKNFITLADFKSIKSFGYKTKFGKNTEQYEQSFHNQLQLSTYKVGIKEQFGKVDKMMLIYYNKDDARMNYLEVSDSFEYDTLEYWNNANRIIGEANGNEKSIDLLARNRDNLIPHYDWECRYCNYAYICKVKKLKKK